ALDLYCGAGLFAAGLAEAVGPEGAVFGVESESAAVRDARANLRDLPQARVERGRVEDALDRFEIERADLVVVDPPRAGLGRAVVDRIAALEPSRIVYVSCDPATLARDLGWLAGHGYPLADLRAFDAFPMPHHLECVALMTRQVRSRPCCPGGPSAGPADQAALGPAHALGRPEGLQPVLRVQLGHRARQVVAYRPPRQVQLARDPRDRVPVGGQPQRGALPVGERAVAGRHRGGGQLGVEIAPARHDLADRHGQLLGGGVLAEEPAHPGGHRPPQVAGPAQARQDHDPALRADLLG